MAILVISGLAVGLAFGYALQRGRFCSNTGFRDVLLTADSTMFRAWALAVLVQLVGVTALNSLGLLPISVPPFWWAANLLGGLVFGAGMVLAGGCSSGTCYRVGEGMSGSLLALLAFGAGLLVMDRGALAPLQRALQNGVIGADGESLTLANLLGVNSWLVVVPLVVAAGWWLFRSGGSKYRSGGWSWQRSGLTLGFVGIAAWLSSAASGRDFGLSMTGPLRVWFEGIFLGGLALDWGAFLIVGLFLGAFVSAASHKELRWRVPKGERLLQSAIGGLMMGLGAQLAGGCTIGHSLTGLSVLSVASVVTTASIIFGAWATSWWLFVRPARQFQRQSQPAITGD
ncbi:MAG: YeeE/YedE family protein [Trueperaceae bacterium]